MSEELDMPIAVIDTRKPQEGYAVYYKQVGMLVPEGAKFLRLGFYRQSFYVSTE